MVALLGAALPYVQIFLAVLLIAGVLLQQRGSSLGGAFGGGSDSGTVYYTRRGAEKVLFQATIVIAFLFALAAFVNLYL